LKFQRDSFKVTLYEKRYIERKRRRPRERLAGALENTRFRASAGTKVRRKRKKVKMNQKETRVRASLNKLAACALILTCLLGLALTASALATTGDDGERTATVEVSTAEALQKAIDDSVSDGIVTRTAIKLAENITLTDLYGNEAVEKAGQQVGTIKIPKGARITLTSTPGAIDSETGNFSIFSISGEDTYRVIEVEPGGELTLENIVITGGNATNADGNPGYGGGV
jgi:hypothetical protein